MAVLFKVQVHAQITREACASKLTEDQLSVVVLHNMLADTDQFNSCLQFDNCAFACWATQIAQQWALIDAQPAAGRFGDVGLSAFGRMLHSTQDFYAHSNWVELHLDQPTIPVWDQDTASLPADIVSGTFLLDTQKHCRDGAPTHDDLNKDSPRSKAGATIVSSGPHAGRSLFELAYAAAVTASAAQFQRLRGNSSAAAIAAFGPSVSMTDAVEQVGLLVHGMSDRISLTVCRP